MMSKILTAAILVASLIAAPALAEHGQQAKEARFEYIFNQMDLSGEQRDQVLEIMHNFHHERREAWRERREDKDKEGHKEHRAGGDSVGEGPSREEVRAMREHQAHWEEARAELAERLGEVLDTEQVEDLIAYLDAHRPNSHQRDKHNHGKR